MGNVITRPQTPHEVLSQLNCRFAPGPALQEMVTNHSQFQVFSPTNSLAQIYQLLNIGPADHGERALFYQYLDYLKTLPSDLPGVNGHDRIIQARRENLESAAPLPMYTTTHRSADDPRVTVTQGQPLPHDNLTYIIISTPTEPPTSAATAARPVAMARARVRRNRGV